MEAWVFLILVLATFAFALLKLLARGRDALLEKMAEELVCSFHGTSFRGRIRGRAVRGERAGPGPVRADYKEIAFLAAAAVAARHLARRLFSLGSTSAVRLRLELARPGLPDPDAARALKAAKRYLEEKLGRENGRSERIGKSAAPAPLTSKERNVRPDRRLFDLKASGTELVAILRGEAARPEHARGLIEAALGELDGV